MANLDFGADWGKSALNNFSNGHYGLGAIQLVNGMGEAVVDFAAAYLGASVVGAAASAIGTAITEKSITAGYIDFDIKLNGYLSKLENTITNSYNKIKNSLSGIINSVSNKKSTSNTIRVGRWMSETEYNEMIKSGKVQMSSNGNTTYVANPADAKSFGSQAKTGSLYVEFDVDSSRIYPAGKEGWGQIPGPGSFYDRLNIKKGLPPIDSMPEAQNIEIKGIK